MSSPTATSCEAAGANRFEHPKRRSLTHLYQGILEIGPHLID